MSNNSKLVDHFDQGCSNFQPKLGTIMSLHAFLEQQESKTKYVSQILIASNTNSKNEFSKQVFSYF